MKIEKQDINKQAHNSVLVQLKKAQARKPLPTIMINSPNTNDRTLLINC